MAESFDYMLVCHQLAKSISSTVRVYKGNQCLAYYSVWELEPDPVMPYLSNMLSSGTLSSGTLQKSKYGIITTPLFQFYSYFIVHKKYCFIMGPSGIAAYDDKQMGMLMLTLGISKEEQKSYIHRLRCAPTTSLEKSICLVKLLVYTMDGITLDTDAIYLDEKSTDQWNIVERKNMNKAMQLADETDEKKEVACAYDLEIMILSLVRNGQSDKLRDLSSSLPSHKAGKMAHDTLRQIRNEGICSVTITARAAIEGGMDCGVAFQLSDFYIQKFELLHDFNTITRLKWDMLMDYCSRVHDIKYGLLETSPLVKKCAKYISRNIAMNIRVEEMAEYMHISRSYLCTRFKKEAKLTLTEYIQKEKILEAKRLLMHTNRSLLEISNYLAFSSQSHFQRVFKKIAGMTPTEFREPEGQR